MKDNEVTPAMLQCHCVTEQTLVGRDPCVCPCAAEGEGRSASPKTRAGHGQTFAFAEWEGCFRQPLACTRTLHFLLPPTVLSSGLLRGTKRWKKWLILRLPLTFALQSAPYRFPLKRAQPDTTVRRAAAILQTWNIWRSGWLSSSQPTCSFNKRAPCHGYCTFATGT